MLSITRTRGLPAFRATRVLTASPRSNAASLRLPCGWSLQLSLPVNAPGSRGCRDGFFGCRPPRAGMTSGSGRGRCKGLCSSALVANDGDCAATASSGGFPRCGSGPGLRSQPSCASGATGGGGVQMYADKPLAICISPRMLVCHALPPMRARVRSLLSLTLRCAGCGSRCGALHVRCWWRV